VTTDGGWGGAAASLNTAWLPPEMRALETSSECESRMILAAGKADRPQPRWARNRRVSSLRCGPRGPAPPKRASHPQKVAASTAARTPKASKAIPDPNPVDALGLMPVRRWTMRLIATASTIRVARH
jgi:hypothetical protein